MTCRVVLYSNSAVTWLYVSQDVYNCSSVQLMNNDAETMLNNIIHSWWYDMMSVPMDTHTYWPLNSQTCVDLKTAKHVINPKQSNMYWIHDWQTRIEPIINEYRSTASIIRCHQRLYHDPKALRNHQKCTVQKPILSCRESLQARRPCNLIVCQHHIQVNIQEVRCLGQWDTRRHMKNVIVWHKCGGDTSVVTFSCSTWLLYPRAWRFPPLLHIKSPRPPGRLSVNLSFHECIQWPPCHALRWVIVCVWYRHLGARVNTTDGVRSVALICLADLHHLAAIRQWRKILDGIMRMWGIQMWRTDEIVVE